MDPCEKERHNYLTYEYTEEDQGLQDSELITIQRHLLHYLLARCSEYTRVHTHEQGNQNHYYSASLDSKNVKLLEIL